MGKQTGRAPEQLDAGPLLFLFQHCHHGVEILVRLPKRGALGRHVAIVEGIKRRAEFFHELKGHPHPLLGHGDGIGAVLPRPDSGANAEHVRAQAAEGMPVSH